MTPHLTWDSNCFYADGKPIPLISGEFHYFRVPKSAWKERLILLKESGANTVATYVPWIIHEPEEGKILFDDIPERSLTDFLKLCCELEIMVIIRPGPYCYSELCRDGVPFWIYDKYPETLAVGVNGEYSRDCLNASYLHPIFLDRARKYFRAVDALIKPFLTTNGGCIVSVQADNEIGGIHFWRGFFDCNPEAMGFCREDGHFVRFMTDRYGDISKLNKAYGTSFSSFCDIYPYKNTPEENTPEGRRFDHDYRAFYKHSLELYIKTVCSWFEEDGIDVCYCTNSGNMGFISLMRDIPKQNEKHNFLMGFDNYYSLSPTAGISMTPEKTVKCAMAIDMLEAIGMPPSVLEMQSGSFSCFPPIFPENVYGFYMTHVAFGMKGSNYYVFTGGANFENTGNNVEIYDYHAPISAEGEIRPMYYFQKKRNEYSLNNSWLLREQREYDIQVGFNFEIETDNRFPKKRYSEKGLNPCKYYPEILMALGLHARLFKCKDIGGELDITKPLIVPTDERMSREKQESLADFVKRGGRLILTPTVPEYDEEFYPCTVLKDLLGVGSAELVEDYEPITLCTGEKVFGVKKYTHSGFGGQVLATSADARPVIEYKNVERGSVILMGVEFAYSQFCHADMLHLCLDTLGCRRRVVTECRNIMATLFENRERATLFLINNLTGEVTADYTVEANGKSFTLKNISVPPMSTIPIDLE